MRQVKDTRQSNSTIQLSDCLLGGLAMFSLKDSSLLSYVKQYKERESNLQNIYGIKACPSDGAMRTILDKIPPFANDERVYDLLFVLF